MRQQKVVTTKRKLSLALFKFHIIICGSGTESEMALCGRTFPPLI